MIYYSKPKKIYISKYFSLRWTDGGDPCERSQPPALRVQPQQAALRVEPQQTAPPSHLHPPPPPYPDATSCVLCPSLPRPCPVDNMIVVETSEETRVRVEVTLVWNSEWNISNNLFLFLHFIQLYCFTSLYIDLLTINVDSFRVKRLWMLIHCWVITEESLYNIEPFHSRSKIIIRIFYIRKIGSMVVM